MLSASSSSLAKRSSLLARASLAASKLGLNSSTTALDQPNSCSNSADERMFSSMGSSTSTSTAADSSTSSTSSSPLFFFSRQSRASIEINRGFSSSAIVASSSGKDDGEGNGTSTASSPSNNGDSDSNWSNPMPSLEAIDDFLDEWGRLIDEGDAEGVLQLLEEKTKDVPGLPPLSEVWASATAAEDERAARRAHETAAQLEAASRRQRLVDEQGRSYATGRRKEAVARVWLRPARGSSKAASGREEENATSTKRNDVGRVWINGAPLDAYFPSAPTSRAADVLAPFVVTRTVGEFDVRATVKGGGPTGQAQAIRHGIARALQLWDPEARPALKSAGLLTRDSRSVERKKPGRAKARKAFQWVKR